MVQPHSLQIPRGSADPRAAPATRETLAQCAWQTSSCCGADPEYRAPGPPWGVGGHLWGDRKSARGVHQSAHMPVGASVSPVYHHACYLEHRYPAMAPPAANHLPHHQLPRLDWTFVGCTQPAACQMARRWWNQWSSRSFVAAWVAALRMP